MRKTAAKPSWTAAVTSAPATMTPSAIYNVAQRLRMPKRNAATVPVHAPVTGSGMATNRARPMASYFSTTLALRRVRSNSHVRNRSMIWIRRSFSEANSQNSSSGITGTRLPTTASR